MREKFEILQKQSDVHCDNVCKVAYVSMVSWPVDEGLGRRGKELVSSLMLLWGSQRTLTITF